MLKRKIKITRHIFLLTFLIIACAQITFAQDDNKYSHDSLRVDYNYINSFPQNAEIYINDEYIGNTPGFFRWQDSLFPKKIKISMTGYIDYTEQVQDASLINRTYNLVSLSSSGSNKISLVKEDKSSYFKKPRKIIPIVLSGLAAFGAGAAAFYFKSLAIENRDFHDEFNDEAALERKKKYDIISGISLAVCQVGLGALMYYLFIDN